MELENRDGNVVYSIEVDTASGKVDVTVDPGNGNVLASQADHAD